MAGGERVMDGVVGTVDRMGVVSGLTAVCTMVRWSTGSGYQPGLYLQSAC